jgi:hypothetical protein
MKNMTQKQMRELTKLANDFTLKNPILPCLSAGKTFCSYARSIDEKITNQHTKYKTLLLPDLSKSNTLSVYSDYGGEHKESKYQTYTYLFHGYDSIQLFNQRIIEIRKSYNIYDPYKEISFKSLNHGPLKAALPEILTAANNFINGLLVTILVDKRINSTFGLNIKENRKEINRQLEAQNMRIWKDKVFLKLLYIIHTISYFSKLLGTKGQKFFWMTDNDSIVANEIMKKSCAQLLVNLMAEYTEPEYFSFFGYATPFEDNREIDFTSLLSISDLVAGAISDYYQNTEKYGKPMVSSSEVDQIITFTSIQGILLRKICLIFNYSTKDEYKVGTISWGYNKEPEGEFVPVFM